jgi:glycosyltransferase involved in cell wall biosynthesis
MPDGAERAREIVDDRVRSAGPSLAVVVIAVGAAPELLDAVRSLLEQDVAVEIVVVNTGGGDAARLLGDHGLEVPVVERAERLFAGAARNLGIDATTAPFVAFLASDCRAAPGWARHRVARHRAGIGAVSSAVVSSHPGSVVAWAAHLATFPRRLPGCRPAEALRYGVSYERSIFARHGRFREDMRTGEDTEFNWRLPRELWPVWAPDVRTIHLNPTRFRDLLRDRWRRGRRAAQAWHELGARRPKMIAPLAFGEIPIIIGLSRRAVEPPDRLRAFAAWALLPAAAAAFALGALTAPVPWRRRTAPSASDAR